MSESAFGVEHGDEISKIGLPKPKMNPLGQMKNAFKGAGAGVKNAVKPAALPQMPGKIGATQRPQGAGVGMGRGMGMPAAQGARPAQSMSFGGNRNRRP